MAFIYNGTTFTSANNIKYNGNDVTELVYNGTTVWKKAEPVTVTTPTIANIKEYFNGFDNDETLDIDPDTNKLRLGASIWNSKTAPGVDKKQDDLISIKKEGYSTATIWFQYCDFFDGGCHYSISMTKGNGTTGSDNFSYTDANFYLGESVFYPNSTISYTLPTRDATLHLVSRAYGYHPDNWKCTAFLYLTKFTLS